MGQNLWGYDYEGVEVVFIFTKYDFFEFLNIGEIYFCLLTTHVTPQFCVRNSLGYIIESISDKMTNPFQGESGRD